MHRVLIWGLALLVPLPAAWSQEEKKSAGTMKFEGKLSPDDPRDKKLAKSPHKVHTMKMKAGQAYQIDLTSTAFDSFLRLEDSSGKQLAEDDDGGGFPNARIVFTPPRDGNYRIIVTSFDAKTGDYSLTVAAPSGASLAATAALEKVKAEQQQAFQQLFQDVSARFVERFAKVAEDYPNEPAGRQALQFANQGVSTLGQSSSPAAIKALRNLVETSSHPSLRAQAAVAIAQTMRSQYEKAYQDRNEKAAALYKEAEDTLEAMAKKFAGNPALQNQFDDALFMLRHLTVGKAAPEIEGEDLDGKKFKLSDYRGKVVVLDFWGNW